MLEKLKGWRTMFVSVVGLLPFVLDAVNAVDLDNGMIAAVSTGALAAVALLRLFTNTPVFKSKPEVPAVAEQDQPDGQ